MTAPSPLASSRFLARNPSVQAFTIIAKNYVPFARVLARSFLTHHPGSRFSVFVVDEWSGFIKPSTEAFELLGPEDVPIPEFDAMARRYDVLELSTAVKPWILQHLLQDPDAGSVLYLDPDIKIYDSLDELGQLCASHGIVLIPHLTRPIPRDGRRPSELDILVSGTYNLGFLGMSHTEQTDDFLHWWSERLETDCFVDPNRGFFVDQRWIDLLPGMLDVAILRDPGYDVAYWNLHYRDISRSASGYSVNGSPLRFFHFTGYDPFAPHRLSRHQNRIQLKKRPVIAELCDEYRRDLLEAGYEEARAWPYQPRNARRPVQQVPPTPTADVPIERPHVARRRSLGRRIVDLENLIEGNRRSGASGVTIAKEVITAVTPIRTPRIRARVRRRAKSQPPPPSGIDQRWGVNVVGYLSAELGVGELGRQIIGGLQACEVPVHAVAEAPAAHRAEHQYVSVTPDEARYPVNLLCVNADMLPTVRRRIGESWFRDRITIGFWSWEVLAFPETLWPSFDLVDEVWVHSRHIADALSGCSSTPVTQIRIPVVPDAPAKLDRKSLWLPDNYTFLFVFDYLSVFERKNPLGLISAFAEAFPPGSGASLVVKCINASHRPAEHDLLVADAERHPDIYVQEGYINAAEKNALLANCDCYISLHRAEGFGFTLAEGMYFGRPVIATGYSGNLDFMNVENSYLVDYDLVPIGPASDPYPADGQWADPDLDHAARLMREVFEDREKSREIGARGAADIRRTHSRNAAGATMRRRLEEIRENQGGKSAAGDLEYLGGRA